MSKLTKEQQLEQEIAAQSDAEEIYCKDLTTYGEPLKWVAVRSKALGKQVIREQVYREVADPKTGRVVGHERISDKVATGNYGEMPEQARASVIEKRFK